MTDLHWKPVICGESFEMRDLKRPFCRSTYCDTMCHTTSNCHTAFIFDLSRNAVSNSHSYLWCTARWNDRCMVDKHSPTVPAFSNSRVVHKRSVRSHRSTHGNDHTNRVASLHTSRSPKDIRNYIHIRLTLQKRILDKPSHNQWFPERPETPHRNHLPTSFARIRRSPIKRSARSWAPKFCVSSAHSFSQRSISRQNNHIQRSTVM